MPAPSPSLLCGCKGRIVRSLLAVVFSGNLPYISASCVLTPGCMLKPRHDPVDQGPASSCPVDQLSVIAGATGGRLQLARQERRTLCCLLLRSRPHARDTNISGPQAHVAGSPHKGLSPLTGAASRAVTAVDVRWQHRNSASMTMLALLIFAVQPTQAGKWLCSQACLLVQVWNHRWRHPGTEKVTILPQKQKQAHSSQPGGLQ